MHTLVLHAYLGIVLLSHRLQLFRFSGCCQCSKMAVLTYTPTNSVSESQLLRNPAQTWYIVHLFPLSAVLVDVFRCNYVLLLLW